MQGFRKVLRGGAEAIAEASTLILTPVLSLFPQRSAERRVKLQAAADAADATSATVRGLHEYLFGQQCLLGPIFLLGSLQTRASITSGSLALVGTVARTRNIKQQVGHLTLHACLGQGRPVQGPHRFRSWALLRPETPRVHYATLREIHRGRGASATGGADDMRTDVFRVDALRH